MKYLLICAMDSEAEGFRSMLSGRSDCSVGDLTFSSGSLCGKDVTVVKCGVGKVNAALCAQTSILRFAPDVVLNVGVAGGIGDGVVTGTVVIGSGTVQYDFDLTALGEEDGLPAPCTPSVYEPLYACARETLGDPRVFLGTVATGDRFVGDAETASRIRDRHAALACEMEGGAVAQVCAASGVACGILRAISDNANEHSNVDFPTFLASAVKDTERIVLSYLSAQKD